MAGLEEVEGISAYNELCGVCMTLKDSSCFHLKEWALAVCVFWKVHLKERHTRSVRRCHVRILHILCTCTLYASISSVLRKMSCSELNEHRIESFELP